MAGSSEPAFLLNAQRKGAVAPVDYLLLQQPLCYRWFKIEKRHFAQKKLEKNVKNSAM